MSAGSQGVMIIRYTGHTADAPNMAGSEMLLDLRNLGCSQTTCYRCQAVHLAMKQSPLLLRMGYKHMPTLAAAISTEDSAKSFLTTGLE